MRVPCPNCSTEYDVPDAALAGRSRKLRCERCQHAWRTPGPGSDAPITRAPPPAPAWAVPPPRKPGPAPAQAAPAARAEPAQISPPPPPPPAQPPPAASWPPPVALVSPLPGAPPPAVLFPQPPIAVVSAPAPQPPAPVQFPGPAPAAAYEPAVPVWQPMAEPDNLIRFPPPEARQFGKPVDESAEAEINQAVAQEERWQPLTPVPGEAGAPAPVSFPDSAYSAYASPSEDESLPAFLTAAGADETLMLTAPYATVGGDRFAELVYAARNNAIELEPEKPPPPPVRTSNMKLFVSLVLAFLLAVAFLEHKEISHFIPATAPFFASIGLK